MVKVTAPLLSLAASGTIANAITYATWKGIKYGRLRVIPQNPKTAAQTAQRTLFSNAVLGWHAEDAPSKAEWEAAASGTAMSGFNYYVQQYIAAGDDPGSPPA